MASIEKEEGFKVAPLEGSSNYWTWKFSMKMALMVKKYADKHDEQEVEHVAKSAKIAF